MKAAFTHSVKYLSYMDLETFDADAVRARRETMLLRQLFRATHTMNATMTQRLRALGWVEFQPVFTSVLGHLDTEGTTVTTLSERTGTTRQAVSQLTRSMEQLGLVEREPNPSDGRSVIVRHTQKGRQILLDALDVMTAIETEYAEQVGPASLSELKDHLVALLSAIDARGGLQPASVPSRNQL